MLLGWSQSLDLMKTISREKQFSHLKTDYFVCGVVDVACQTTGHCIWHPAWNETSGFVALFSLFGWEKILENIFFPSDNVCVERNFQICVSLTWEVQLSILYFYWSDSSPVLWFRGALQHWRPSSWHILCIYGEYRYYCFIASGYSNGTSTLTCINLFCSSYGIKSCCEICKNSLEISTQQMFMNSKCMSLQFLRKKKFCGSFSRKQESQKGDF